MRLFHVTPAFLSTPLLLNQHRTCHLLISEISRGTVFGPRGGMARYQNHAGFLAWMHHLCVDELTMRGNEHQSPITRDYYATAPVRRQLYIYIPASRVARDIADLRTKEREFEAAGKMYDSRLPLRSAGNQLIADLAVAKARGVQERWLQ